MGMEKTTVTADAAIRLMLHYPYWSELYYSMNVVRVPDDAKGRGGQKYTLATDGKCLYVSEPFWKTLALDHKITALAHEVCHKMLHHPTRMGNRIPLLANIAMDHVVNNLLEENNFKPIPGYWVCDKKYRGWSFEAVYNDLLKQLPQKPQSGKGKGQKGQGTPQPGQGQPGDGDECDDDGGYDVPAEWKKLFRDVMKFKGSAAEIEKFEAEVEQGVQKALATARAMGHAPAGIEMGLKNAFTHAKEPWYNHLHRYMQALSTSEYNWAHLNRRYLAVHRIFAPANQSEALGEVVIFRDCSGSCYSQAEQCRFMEHVWAILAEAKPSKVHIIDFDVGIHQHVELDVGDTEPCINPVGGGGTSFADLFDYLEEHGIIPAVAIVLTDMYGKFPDHEPSFPVVWASVTDVNEAPFGQVINVE